MRAPPGLLVRAGQRLVVSTAGGPAGRLWAASYRCLTQAVPPILIRGEQDASVYARAGTAGEDFVPGLSDIYLAIVLEPDAAGPGFAAERVRRRFTSIAQRLPAVRFLFDAPCVYDEAELRELAGSSYATFGLAGVPPGGAAYTADLSLLDRRRILNLAVVSRRGLGGQRSVEGGRLENEPLAPGEERAGLATNVQRAAQAGDIRERRCISDAVTITQDLDGGEAPSADRDARVCLQLGYDLLRVEIVPRDDCNSRNTERLPHDSPDHGKDVVDDQRRPKSGGFTDNLLRIPACVGDEATGQRHRLVVGLVERVTTVHVDHVRACSLDPFGSPRISKDVDDCSLLDKPGDERPEEREVIRLGDREHRNDGCSLGQVGPFLSSRRSASGTRPPQGRAAHRGQ